MNKILLAISILLLYGCNKPAKDYDYVSLNPIAGWEKGEDLCFSLEMEDTLQTYALYFTARIKNTQSLNEISALPAEVILLSPSGKRYSSIISLPLNIIQKREHYRQSNGVMEIEWPFIKNIRNKECGIWQITLKQTFGSEVYKNITGFGVSYKEEQ